MTTYSSLPAYLLGTACIGRGIMAAIWPRAEYAHMGLPLEASAHASADGAASPLMYYKGIREVSFGMTLVALQQRGLDEALTLFSAIVSLARFADGLVVWFHGGPELRHKAWGHWITGIFFAGYHGGNTKRFRTIDNTTSAPAMSSPPESPLRILITVKQRHAHIWQEAWEHPEKMISRALKYLKYDHLVSPDDKYDTSDCRFIAIDRWDSVVFIVFDLFNTQYDHLDAHLDGKNELPTRVVRISQGDNSYLIKASVVQHIKYLNDEVRELHESHGWEERVPFRIDHYNGAYPSYRNSRNLRKMTTS